MNERPFDKDRQFLQPFVGHVLECTGVLAHFGYIPVRRGTYNMPTAVLSSIAIEANGVKRILSHLHVQDTWQLLGMKAGVRVRFRARVHEYLRKSGTVSWSLTGPREVSIVSEVCQSNIV
jgi:hypothetical protein